MLNSGKSCHNIWIFVFSEKENCTAWETSTEKPMQIALFFSAAPKLLLDFSQQLQKARKSSNWAAQQ